MFLGLILLIAGIVLLWKVPDRWLPFALVLAVALIILYGSNILDF